MYSAIVYNSLTGSCERIAHELSRQLHIPAKPMGKPVRPGGQVIYVSWLFAAGMVGLKKAMKKYNVKAVVMVGMGAVTEETAEFMAKKNDIPADIKVFCVQGGFHSSKLPLPYRLIMKVKCKDIVERLEKKGSLNEQERALLHMASTGDGNPASWDMTEIVKKL